MITKQELELWFDKLFELIVDCFICSMNLQRLIEKGDEVEENIKRHGFFQQHYFQLRFILSIQLDKLFSKSSGQKFSFHKLFNRLENEKYDIELSNRLVKNKNDNFTNTFKNRKEIIQKINLLRQKIQTYASTIEKVNSLRDKIYAHSDKIEAGQIEIVTTEDFRKLAVLASETYNALRLAFFGRTTMFDHTKDWDIGFILYRMVEDRKNFMKDF